MNTHVLGFGLGAALAVFAPPAAVDGAVAAGTIATTRVGIYDSRVIAFAHFWSAPEQQHLKEQMGAARAAKERGDLTRYRELSYELSEWQKESHLAVFSTAPATAALTALSPRLPDLRNELGVDRFVSKWDSKALSEIPVANQIDVTDRLAREFIDPSPKQLQTIAAIKTAKPLPLWKAKLMTAMGGL